MRILYNKVVQWWKKQSGEMLLAYGFMAYTLTLFLWHLIDKIIAFTVVSDEIIWQFM